VHPLAVEDLRKHYGQHPAVDGLTFAVPRGSVCGFLGSNGPGKTTTLLGFAAPDGGTSRVDGRVAGR
jgi:ABC-2 type transport system ATP-binding protein